MNIRNLVLVIALLVVIVPVSASAQIRGSVQVDTQTGVSTQGKKVVATTSVDASVRTNNSGRGNVDNRNTLLQERSTSSKPAVRSNSGKNVALSATTSATTSVRGYRVGKKTAEEVFQKQKDHIVRQLGQALNNLKQVRARIVTRIQKATQTGRDMTEPSRLLVIADNKISIAEQAINTLVSFNFQGATTASTSVDLSVPRQLNKLAIKDIKDAHRALVDVVISIAQNMGLGGGSTTDRPKPKNNVNATTSTNVSATTTATSTTVTATTTTSVTATTTATSTATSSTQ